MKTKEELLSWVVENLDYLEHSDPDQSGFFPHKCEECIYSIKTEVYRDKYGSTVDIPLEPSEWDCELSCLQYRDLSLEDYISLRIEESLQ